MGTYFQGRKIGFNEKKRMRKKALFKFNSIPKSPFAAISTLEEVNPAKRKSMIRNINNIFHRINLSEQEIRILLGIFTTLNGLNNKS